MEIFKAIELVFPVFCIIGLGYLFARFKKLSLEPIIEVLLYLTIPALVISSLSKKKLVITDLAVVSLSALIVILGTGLLAYIYLRIIKRQDLRGFYLPVMFMNSGNMAFPLALLAFGVEGLAVAVLSSHQLGTECFCGSSGGIDRGLVPDMFLAMTTTWPNPY